MNMWDQRYNSNDFAYGTRPNDFLKSVTSLLPKSGKALSLAEGEGRNAVYLAEQGYHVLGVDSSSVGLEKAQQLAQAKGVTIQTQCADLQDFVIEKNQYDLVNIIFCHLPQPLRTQVFRAAEAGLKSGGALVMEVYANDQINYKTGGPSDTNMLMSFSDVDNYFPNLKFVIKQRIVRTIHEGSYHNGLSSVIQLLGFKP